jgi:transposase-like protein
MINRNTYSNELKLKAVLESYQRDTTIEAARKKFNLSRSVLNRWRLQFQKYAAGIFDLVKKKAKKKPANVMTPEEMQQVIGELTLENRILKKL